MWGAGRAPHAIFNGGSLDKQHRGHPGQGGGDNVVPYRRPVNINIGAVIFLVVLVYILISVLAYLRSEKVAGYEVRTGSLSSNRVYHGVALREETIVGSEFAGYVNFYNEETDRLAKGNLAYTIDESGKIMDYINSQNAGEIELSAQDLSDIRSEIMNFSSAFDPHSFSAVYDFQASVTSAAQRISSSSILQNIRTMDAAGLSASIHYCYAPESGDLVFSTDGYEDKTWETISAADLDRTEYRKSTIENGQLVSIGDPVYKLMTNEHWSIVFEAQDAEEAQSLVDLEYVRVRFLKNQDESWAAVTSRADPQGRILVRLSFTNSMVTFCTDRFIDIELIASDVEGLKVPNSAIVESDFFLVPGDFIVTGRGGDRGVLKESYAEDGTRSTAFVSSPPYYEKDGMYYLDQSVLSAGDVIYRTDSSDTYVLSRTAKLIGVYNINKGYADFKIVDILYSNDEYSIVDKNTAYGLSEYDYIVLDAANVSPDDFVYD